ncbi:MAG: DUF1947 domain-containing protein [Candidatus Thorarchaeota archaeon]
MPKIERVRKRHLMKKREMKRELERIEKILSSPVVGLGAKSQFEEGILDDGSRIIILNNEIIFFEEDGNLYPTLRALLDGIVKIPQIAVDMGAVKFVVNGADIMRPGITAIDDDILEGSVVAVIDERHGKPLAVGVSKMSSEDLRAATSGKVILSVHHINDDLWNFSKS